MKNIPIILLLFMLLKPEALYAEEKNLLPDNIITKKHGLLYYHNNKYITTGRIRTLLHSTNDSKIEFFMSRYYYWTNVFMWPRIFGALTTLAGGIMIAVGEGEVKTAGLGICISGSFLWGGTEIANFFVRRHFLNKAIERYNDIITDLNSGMTVYRKNDMKLQFEVTYTF